MSTNKDMEYFCVNYTGRKGGGPLDAIEMTKGLIQNGVPVIAIISEKIENISDWYALPIDVIVVKGNKNIFRILLTTILFPFTIGPKIKRRTERYNIKYVYCPMGSIWTHKINALFKDAKSMGVVHDPIPHSGDEWMEKYLKDSNFQYDLLAVHTEKYREYIENKYNKPTYFIPLGRHDMYKRCKYKQKIIDYDKTKTNFLFFGRIAKYKGLDILAYAYKKLTRKEKDRYSLTIVGHGDFTPYRELYKDIPNLRLINRWIKDEEVESCFKGENIVVVCPYHDASQSGVVLVAMDYGVPLIVTDVGGMADQVIDNVTAIVINPDSEDELAEAMKLLAENRDLREQMSKNQKEEIEKCSWNNSAKILVDLMKEN